MIKIPLSDIQNFLLENYGIKPVIKELPGYEDLNYILDNEDGRSILKITVSPDAQLSVRAQVNVLESLNKTEGVRGFVPQVFPAISGEMVLEWEFKGEKLLVRILSFLEGQFMGEGSLPVTFFNSLGIFIGRLDKVLSGIEEPLFRLLDLEWDLANFLDHEDLSKFIPIPYDRTLVEYFFLQNRERVAPVSSKLRKSLIHNDINDWNILSAENKFSGLIDFGDMVHTATIHELAIALAYGMMKQDEPLEAAYEIVKGYHSVFHLEELELDILYYLAASRLCTTIIMAARNAHNEPDKEYFQISAQPAWDVLHKWIRINPIKARNTFYKACGFPEPKEVKSKVEQLQTRNQHLPKSLSVSYNEPIGMTGAALQYMYDDEGNTFLDCVNNIPHVGHCHPRVVKAGQKQMAMLNTNTRYLYDSLNEYAQKLLGKFPVGLSKILFVNSGSAATDLAIRLARNHTGKDDFIVLNHAYHGNVSTAIGLSPYKFNHKGGSGKPNNTHITPIPDTYRGKYTVSDPGSSPGQAPDARSIGSKYVDEIEKVIAENNLGSKLAGFIAESIPGCGGQIMLPKNYLGEAYEKIRAAGGVCIADEVQTGFGRVGDKFWAFELYDVVPDIVILGKPMGNSHPIGAVVFTEEIAKSFENGLEFFSSFGGNPVSCEIGNAVLDAIENDGLEENARNTGAFLLKEMKKIQEEANKNGRVLIGDVRGSGLFIGIEIVKDLISREADPVTASALVNKIKEMHILLSTDGPEENVIKFKPPLCFTMDNAKELVGKFRLAITQI